MHLINSFGKRHNVKHEVKIHIVDDTLQMARKDTYRMFQLYFYVHLFNPLESSTLNKKTIEVLLSEIQSTNKEENEYRIEVFAHENNTMHK